jgi:hypothetical protein
MFRKFVLISYWILVKNGFFRLSGTFPFNEDEEIEDVRIN